MERRSIRHRARLGGEVLERRDQAGLLDLASAAAVVYDSPVVVAARAAALGYQVGRLAWNGHTSFLLGTVQVSQPDALKNLRAHPTHGHGHGQGQALVLPIPHVTFRKPF
jgi:hypothetical protein